jgi:hypothetical protein
VRPADGRLGFALAGYVRRASLPLAGGRAGEQSLLASQKRRRSVVSELDEIGCLGWGRGQQGWAIPLREPDEASAPGAMPTQAQKAEKTLP